MPTKLTRKICRVGEAGEELLKNAMQRLSLSARAYNRIPKVARTIADLDQSQALSTEHLAEAIQYRASTGRTGGRESPAPSPTWRTDTESFKPVLSVSPR